jgi:hypothetical protein
MSNQPIVARSNAPIAVSEAAENCASLANRVSVAKAKAFNELPALFKYVHCAGLCAVALAVVLLMTPAAVHRLAFDGEDNSDFFRIGSRLVISASIPLAIGISSDVAVVFFKTTESTGVALGAGAAALVALLGFWLAYPLWHRIRFNS